MAELAVLEKCEVCTAPTLTRREFCTTAAAVVSTAALSPFVVNAKEAKAKPFVKWAGGKGQLLEQLAELLPRDLATRKDFTYIEPFVGGGAMLFYMLSTFPNISRVIINDFNHDLIQCYTAIRNTPDDLIRELEKHQSAYYALKDDDARKAYYLSQRERYNARTTSPIETAALFIFLNRTCFNGLYRVNSKGKFNVPFGRATKPLICDVETIRADSKLLQKVEILCGDFESVESHIKERSFVYFDPPYRPLPNTSSFTAYSKNGFDDSEQKRLAAFCRRLDKAGHQWLLSNSDPTNTDATDKFFDEAFEGFEIRRVMASRMINSKADGRGKITELAIRNYKE